MKRSFVVLCILSAFLAACSLGGQPAEENARSSTGSTRSATGQVLGEEGGSASAVSQTGAILPVNGSGATKSSNGNGQARVVRVEAANWAFTPDLITAQVGEKVTIELVGVSGMHALAVPALGINLAVDPGQTARVDLPTDKAGTFEFHCSIPCGEGHKDMTGEIVIE
ncbi:MAG: cupredoxin domain-containing protein [Candidatus Peribacteraceae bacterium]|nr:cupredoxin domain-containing protein [Candidatus Peribacteraceae bacterium]